MIPPDTFEPHTLADGTTLDVVVSTTIVVRRTGHPDLEFPYPSAGYGGGGLLVSPSGRFAIIHVTSGQSEERFYLVDLAKGTRLVAAPEYEVGECASFAFDDAESCLVMALPFTASEWWESWAYDGLEEDDDDGVAFVPFGVLLFCDTSTGKVRDCELQLLPSVEEAQDQDDYEPYLLPRFVTPGTLSLTMPWGEVRVKRPEDNSPIRIPYPA